MFSIITLLAFDSAKLLLFTCVTKYNILNDILRLIQYFSRMYGLKFIIGTTKMLKLDIQ